MMEEDFAALQRIDTVPAVPSTSKAAAVAQSSRTFSAQVKLEPFLLLAKSARGAGAAALIDQVTAAQGVYTFGELLESKGIAEVSSGQCAWAILIAS